MAHYFNGRMREETFDPTNLKTKLTKQLDVQSQSVMV